MKGFLAKWGNLLLSFGGLLFSKVVARGFEFFTYSLIAHLYGLADYSVLAYVISITGIMKVIGSLGLDKWVAKEIVLRESEQKKIVVNALVLQLIWIVGLYAVYSVGIIFFQSQHRLLFLLAGVYQLGYALLFVLYGIGTGYQRFDLERRSSVLVGAALFVSSILLFFRPAVSYLILPFLSAIAVGVVFAWIYAKRQLVGELEWQLVDWQMILKSIPSAVNYGLTEFCGSMQIFLMYYLIEHLLPDQSYVGLFNSSFMVIILTLFVSQIFLKRIFPLLAKAVDKKQTYYRGLAMTGGVGTAALVAIYLAAPLLVQIVFGGEFRQAIPLLRFGVLVLPVIFANEYVFVLCAAWGWEVEMKWISIFGVLVVPLLGVWLVPRYLVMGAYAAFLGSEILILGLFHLVMHLKLKSQIGSEVVQ